MSDKIVDFQQKLKEQREMKELPKKVKENLEDMTKKAVMLKGLLDDTLYAFSDKHGKPMDITIPAQALCVSGIHLLSTLDEELDEDTIKARTAVRDELLEVIINAVNHYGETSETPLYSHDIGLALMFALNSFNGQHRVFSQLREYEEKHSDKPDG